MFCNNCGNQINPGEKFCNNCGAAVDDVVDSTSSDKKHSNGVGKAIGLILFIFVLVSAVVGACFYFSGKLPSSGWLGEIVSNIETETSTEEESGIDEALVSDNQCVVTFESNGGSSVEPIYVEAGATVQSPEVPTKDGNIFAGWYMDQELEERFLFEDEPVDSDITLYAGWVSGDADSTTADRVLKSIIIVYQKGDNADNVTRNVTLPQSVDDVGINWSSSNSSIVNTDGTVTRNNTSDTNVTLTASVTVGSTSLSQDFVLKVVAKRNEDATDTNYTVLDIQNFNKNNSDYRIKYNDEQTQVTSIEGKYSDITVNNSEDALRVVQEMHSIVGLNNPYDELELYDVSKRTKGVTYKFSQIYNGIEVYEHRISVSVDEDGITNVLSSGVVQTSKLDNMNTEPTISQSDAEAKATEYVGGGYSAVSDETEIIIYASDEYEDSPVLVYEIYLSADDSGIVEYLAFIDASNGDVIRMEGTMVDVSDSSDIGSGKNEKGDKVTFPVAFHLVDFWFYYMEDLNRNIHVYKDGTGTNMYGSEFNVWLDKTAISAYTNLIKVYDWFDSKLDWNFVDEYQHGLDLIMHSSKNINNAAWSNSSEKIYLGDNSDNNLPTVANCLDVVAHEFTHSIVRKKMGRLEYDYDFRGVINEGYADIFGCFIEGDWDFAEDRKFGDEKNPDRSAQNPTQYENPDKYQGEYYIDPYNCDHDSVSVSKLAHTDATLVSHAAYLMKEYGITKDHLIQLWYDSMDVGDWSGRIDFQTVRHNVIATANADGFSDQEKIYIRKAFDDEEIYDERGSVTIKFVDQDGNPLQRNHMVSGTLERSIQDTPQENVMINCDTNSGIEIDEIYYGSYLASLSIEGCENWTGTVEVEEDEMKIIVIPVVEEGNGVVTGTITNATTGYPVAGVGLTVYTGWFRLYGTVGAKYGITDSNGQYSFELESGYYTVKMTKDKYTTGYFNIYVTANEEIIQNASISPIIEMTNSYRVVLTWGENPHDLDSHLVGNLYDGSSYHVYYVSKNGWDAEGNQVANLDVDDTTSYGPETVTFTASSEGIYEYYVHWYSGDGTWATSGGKVEVYNSDQLIDVFYAPAVNSNSGDWKIFELNNGIYRKIDAIQ